MTAQTVSGVTDADRADLRASVKRLLADRSPEAAVRRVMESEAGYDETLWRRLVDELGIASLIVPEAFGGAGYGWRETAVVLEETGAAIYPGPFLSATFATIALSTLADPAVQHELLPAIAGGSTHVSFCAIGAGIPGAQLKRLTVEQCADGSAVISGSLGKVLDAHIADSIVVLVHDAEGDRLLLVDARANGVSTEPLLGMDLTRRLSQVRVDEVAARVIGVSPLPAAGVSAAAALLALAHAAEQLGGAEAAFAATLDYLRTRVQFGRQIGSFQAIKHRCADLAVELESARSTVEAALRAADARSADLSLYAHLAAACCAETYLSVARAMIQLHGGIGFTWEHSAHLHLKRAKTGALLLGLPATHRRLVAAAAGLTLTGAGR